MAVRDVVLHWSNGKVHLRPDYDGPDEEQMYSPGRFTPGKETRYPLYSRLGGPRACLDGCGKSRPHRDSIPGPSSP